MTRIKENNTTEIQRSQRKICIKREKTIEALSLQSKAAGEYKRGTTKITKTTKELEGKVLWILSTLCVLCALCG